MVTVYGIAAGLGDTVYNRVLSFQKDSPSVENDSEAVDPDSDGQLFLPKKEIQSVLSPVNLVNLTEECFDVNFDGQTYQVDTSLDESLQRYLLQKMQRRYVRYLGIVMVEPDSGRVVAMAGFDRINRDGNPCVDARFPAASIFKIVTAAAGIEKCGFSPSSKFTFNGGKYTLYRKQLNDRVNRYSNRISFKDSFAQSVNPVFGKIGALHLGKMPLERYGDAFGFNQTLDFEIPLSPSRLNLTENSYQWAEIASGFNRETTLSPLHGALIGAAIVNRGVFVEPTIVDAVKDGDGRLCYKSSLNTVGTAISPEASDQLHRMMRATVRSGTSRKAFRGASKDRILSQLYIGGKTGSISSSKVRDVRYDWFVGFAEEKQGDKKLAVAVMVAHEKYIGKRAAYYARIAMRKYFDQYFDLVKASDTYKADNHSKKGNKAA